MKLVQLVHKGCIETLTHGMWKRDRLYLGPPDPVSFWKLGAFL